MRSYASGNGCFRGLMRAKVIHTCLDCSVFLAGKSRSWHGGSLDSEQEREAALSFIKMLSQKIRSRNTLISLKCKNTKVSHTQNIVALQNL